MFVRMTARALALLLLATGIRPLAAAMKPADAAGGSAPSGAAAGSEVSPSDDPLLTSLVEEALARNPDVATVRQAAEAAQSRPAQGRSLPNPMASLVYTNDGTSPSLGLQEMTTLALMGSQDLPFPGKRALRGEILGREARQVAEQLGRTKLTIEASVKRAYYGLLLARDLLDLIKDQAEVWKQIEGVARARYVAGQGAQQDVIRVQIEVARIDQLLAEQNAEAEIRLAELNRLLNRPASASLKTTSHLTLQPKPGSLEEVIGDLTGISPEVRSAALGVEKADLAVALARKEFKPDFNVQSGYMNRGGLPPMWLAGVGVSLPIYTTRLRAGLAEAEAQHRSSQSLVESVRLQLRFRTQERLAQLAATEKVAELYRGGIIPQDRMSVESAIASYQTGKVPFIAVLEALTSLYNDRTTHLGLLANHARIRASLDEASLEGTSSMSSAGASGMAAVGGSSLSMAGGGGAAASASGAMGSSSGSMGK